MAVASVVVGVDSSPESDEALTWALEEGRLRNLPVRVVNVWHPTDDPQEIERLMELQSVVQLRAGLVDEVASSVRAVVEQAQATDVAVTSEVLYGHPVRELIRTADTDSLLVVGSRGRGSLTGSILGSVSQGCAQYANGHVVVVRGRRPDPAAGRVLVGVDGSSTSVQALRFADQEARARGAALQVVHAWTLPYLGFAGRSGSLPQDAIDEFAARAGETLRDSMRRGSIDATRPDVEMWLVEGLPNLSLLQAAGNADLLVVGSRGYGGWKGLLMGSVSAQCVTQAPCPVAVVRGGDDNPTNAP
ncbi:universal stress protein [Paractinoplanes rishiriensis]|uniref:universal stress protein n=1 Tax=Paractinoplanes rishiriensis TaxID=1050105 RepID=UPI0019431DD2|nr:universal stress protein [Actinoplanes rishiriensis]